MAFRKKVPLSESPFAPHNHVGVSDPHMMRISLFLKIFGLSLLVIGPILLLGYILLEKSILLETRHQIKENNRLLMKELSSSLAIPLLNGDRLGVEDNIAVFEHAKGVLDIRVRDRKGHVIGELSPHHRMDDSQKTQSPKKPSDRSTAPLGNGHPVPHPLTLHTRITFQGIPVGQVALSMSDAPYRRIREKIRETFLLLGGGSLALAFAGSLLLAAFISRPIRELRDASLQLIKGEFAPVRAPAIADETSDLVTAFNQMAGEILHKKLLEKALDRYVSRDVAESLILHPERIHLGGVRQETVILFCDIRNFTRLSSKLPPEEVVEILNSYFDAFIDMVFRYRGSVNNIMGDGLMIVFGIPEFLPDHPELALNCALEMRNSIEALSEERKRAGKPHADFGFGLHAGVGILGNIGSRNRMEYTIIGEAVNLAAKLQQEAGAGEILVTEALLNRIPEDKRPTIREKRSISPAGVDHFIEVYVV